MTQAEKLAWADGWNYLLHSPVMGPPDDASEAFKSGYVAAAEHYDQTGELLWACDYLAMKDDTKEPSS